jgi:hypothetical protein
MGRPKGSKNKKDGDAAPEAGHNTALSEAEKQALFVRGLAELGSLIEEKNEIVADVRNQRKRIVGYGFEPWQIDFALKLRKDSDGEAIEHRRQEAMIARFLSHPIGTQPDMFDVDRTPAVDKSYQDGKVAGAAGKTAQSPHSPGHRTGSILAEGLARSAGRSRKRFQKAGDQGRGPAGTRGRLMIVAGFDLATTSGCAILDGTKVLHVEAHRPAGKEDPEIFHGFRVWFRSMLVSHQVQEVAIEQPLVTNIAAPDTRPNAKPGQTHNPVTMKTYLRLYGMRAHAVEICASLNIPCREVHQASWRKSFTGNGRGDQRGYAEAGAAAGARPEVEGRGRGGRHRVASQWRTDAEA